MRESAIAAFPEPWSEAAIGVNKTDRRAPPIGPVSGRAAVYWACRGLKTNLIWMPAFHCGVEVQAALDAGLRVGFYRIAPDLSVDEEDLERKLRRQHGAALLIHYYGFPQAGVERIARMCRELDAPLIEDCAHALFSRYHGRALGEFAPMAVFSLRKTLPVLERGYLKSAVKRALGERLTNAYRRTRTGQVCKPDAPSEYSLRVSWISRAIISRCSERAIVSARRANYAAIDRMLRGVPGYAPVFGDLPEGVCPLFLPMWARNRTEVMQWLADWRIESFRFGALPHPALNSAEWPETGRLRDGILCLPVHQQLRARDLERMCATLAIALR